MYTLSVFICMHTGAWYSCVTSVKSTGTLKDSASSLMQRRIPHGAQFSQSYTIFFILYFRQPSDFYFWHKVNSRHKKFWTFGKSQKAAWKFPETCMTRSMIPIFLETAGGMVENSLGNNEYHTLFYFFYTSMLSLESDGTLTWTLGSSAGF